MLASSKFALKAFSCAPRSTTFPTRPSRRYADDAHAGGRVKIEAPNWDNYKREKYSDRKTRNTFSYLVTGTAAAGMVTISYYIFLYFIISFLVFSRRNIKFSDFLMTVLGSLSAVKNMVLDVVDSMNASADVLALANIEVDLNSIPEGAAVTVKVTRLEL